MLQLLRHVTSFIDGRVRLRHPALYRHEVVAAIRPHVTAIRGVMSAEFNERAGSLLVLYDPALLSREELIRQALPWAQYLDGCLQGSPAAQPRRDRMGESEPASPRRGRNCWRKTVNRGMLATLAVTVGSLALGGKRVHTAAGTLFLVLSGLHAWRYRRSL